MLKTTLAGLRAHLLRLLLTALAITLGVGFVAGTFVLTDTMQAGFDRQFTASADKVSAAVLPKTSDGQIPAAVLDKVKRVRGVQDVQGQVRGDTPLIGKDGRAYGSQSTVGLSIAAGSLQRYEVTKGHPPTGPGDVVLDGTVAKRTGFKVGDQVRVLDAKGRAHSFTVAGLMDFGIDQEIGFRGAVGFAGPTAVQMTGKHGYVEIDVRGTNVRDGVAAAAGPSYDVLSSSALAKKLAKNSGVDAGQLGLFFLAFALVALVVAALVIYNTFNILIAQRMREMALLRCVGATRGQVFRSVLVESLVVGAVASALGVLVGIGLGYGGAELFAAASNASIGAVSVSATPILAGLLIGIVVTLVAALLPARAATRVPPIAALRTPSESPVKSRASILRIAAGTLLVLVGLAVCGLALAGKPGQGPFFMVLLGGAVTFLGVVALSPLIVRALSGLVGWLPARLAGVPGRLARENSRRNPKRAAVTTIALTVGVTLMTMFSVALSSAQASTDAMLDKQFPVDYQIHVQYDSNQTVPPTVAEQLRGKPQFSEVTEVRRAATRINGDKTHVSSITQRNLGRAIKPKVLRGSLSALTSGTVALSESQAKNFGVGLGQNVKVGTTPLKVVAILPLDTPLPLITISEADFGSMFPKVKGDDAVYVVNAAGVSADASRAVIDQVTQPYPMVKVSSAADVKAQFTKALDQVFYLVAALLGLAIVISLIGIANTLTLSVVERTRESALLRALGLTRRGLRRMLSIEAVIMAVIGALIGVVLGAGLGAAATSAAFDGAVLGFPVGRIALFVLIAAVAGVLAAALPGRRAARTSIVESLASE